MVVSVFGLGFVGLTTALAFCEYGHKVFGIENSENRRGAIASDHIPFHEPGLDEALTRHLEKEFLIPSTKEEMRDAIRQSDVVYFCVGTPYGERGQADLTALFMAIDEALDLLDGKYSVFVIKSTVPPSTTKERIIPYIISKGVAMPQDLGIANNPEFLREGHCWDDVMNSDFIAIGTEDEKAKEILSKLYAPASAPIHFVSLNTGEFLKYLSNTSLALLISYANEMSIAADRIGGIDTKQAFEILHSEKRWKTGSIRSYLYPGCGYGGYCLPKDTNAFLALSKDLGLSAGILENTISVNDSMARVSAEKILSKADGDTNKKIGILGLSFNSGSSDCRETPAAKIIEELMDMGFKHIEAFDPLAIDEFKNSYNLDIHYHKSQDEIIASCDILVIVTAWPQFAEIKKLTDRSVVDLRYMI